MSIRGDVRWTVVLYILGCTYDRCCRSRAPTGITDIETLLVGYLSAFMWLCFRDHSISGRDSFSTDNGIKG